MPRSIARTGYPARMLNGIDVSHHNGATSYNLDGVSFLFARASYGMTADVSAERHLARARGVVPVLGVYHYLHTGEHAAPAEEQAALFVTRAAILSGSLMLAVDVEPIDWAHPDPPSRVAAMTLAFVRSVQSRSGRPCAVYLPGAYAPTLPLHVDLAQSPLWLADYTPPYPVPAPWADWTVHQAGVRGVDRDVYRGTVDELRAAFGLGSGTSSPEQPAIGRTLRLVTPRLVGPDVRELQRRLNRDGAGLDTDAVYGPRTAAAVRTFQAARGLTVDGVVGVRTWTALVG